MTKNNTQTGLPSLETLLQQTKFSALPVRRTPAKATTPDFILINIPPGHGWSRFRYTHGIPAV